MFSRLFLEREGELSCIYWVHFPNGSTSCCWARLRLSPPHGCRTRYLSHRLLPHWVPVSREPDLVVEPGLTRNCARGCWHPSSYLYHCARQPPPAIYLYSLICLYVLQILCERFPAHCVSMPWETGTPYTFQVARAALWCLEPPTGHSMSQTPLAITDAPSRSLPVFCALPWAGVENVGKPPPLQLTSPSPPLSHCLLL